MPTEPTTPKYDSSPIFIDVEAVPGHVAIQIAGGPAVLISHADWQNVAARLPRAKHWSDTAAATIR